VWATVKKHEERRHEFDRPVTWGEAINPKKVFDNVHIPAGMRLQVLCKKKTKLFGKFIGQQWWKKVTCAWWHPIQGLLIGNIKIKNLDISEADLKKLKVSDRRSIFNFPKEIKLPNGEKTELVSDVDKKSIVGHCLASWQRKRVYDSNYAPGTKVQINGLQQDTANLNNTNGVVQGKDPWSFQSENGQRKGSRFLLEKSPSRRSKRISGRSGKKSNSTNATE